MSAPLPDKAGMVSLAMGPTNHVLLGSCRGGVGLWALESNNVVMLKTNSSKAQSRRKGSYSKVVKALHATQEFAVAGDGEGNLSLFNFLPSSAVDNEIA